MNGCCCNHRGSKAFFYVEHVTLYQKVYIQTCINIFLLLVIGGHKRSINFVYITGDWCMNFPFLVRDQVNIEMHTVRTSFRWIF